MLFQVVSGVSYTWEDSSHNTRIFWITTKVFWGDGMSSLGTGQMFTGHSRIFFFMYAPKSLWTVIATMKLKDAPWKNSYDKSRLCIKKWRHHFADKDLYSQSYGFPSSPAWMWNLDEKKAEHQRIDAFELWCWKRLWESLGLQGDQTSKS